jgi:hypothetical protein
METVKTQSSLVKEVGYDGKDLYITLVPNRKYKYENVPYSEYNKLLNANSMGQYFNCNIRDYYKCVRL